MFACIHDFVRADLIMCMSVSVSYNLTGGDQRLDSGSIVASRMLSVPTLSGIFNGFPLLLGPNSFIAIQVALLTLTRPTPDPQLLPA